jgi:hypothetical protein
MQVFGYTFKNTVECAPSSYSIPNARLVSAELMLEHVGGPTPLTLSKYSNQCKSERAEKITNRHTNVGTFLDRPNYYIFLLTV